MSLIEVNVYESKDGRFLVTSVEVADKFEKDHKNVLRDIRENYADSDWGRLNFELSSYKNSQGKSQPCYSMTRDGFAILAMGFTGEKALVWKLKFLTAFNLMEQELLKLKGKEWLAQRVAGKLLRRRVTDAIAEYIEYSVARGSTNYKLRPNTAYSNFTNMEYKTLFGLAKICDGFRDTLTTMDLNCLASAERVVENTLIDLMEKEIDYKEIYQISKDKVLQLRELLKPIDTTGNPFLLEEPKCL